MNSSYSKWDGDIWIQVIDGVVRRKHPRDDGVWRSWHANSALASEYTRVNGVTEGIKREWHDNGVLAKETPFVSGRVHGTVRQWNREGKLLGEYTMSEGRGITYVWNEDGSPQTEYEQVSENAARGKVWDDLGRARDVFLWNGKPISKARWTKKVEEAGTSK
jgi:MORN repeat protein